MATRQRENVDVRAVARYTRRVEAWMARRGTPAEAAAFQLSQEAWRLLLRLWAVQGQIRPRKEQT
jgi:hypothetical protein